MSRVEPNRNVYVGHRYVPKIFGEWDKQNEYEGLSIVTHQGCSYTSKKRVPVGIDIKNEEFWVVTGNYDAQVEHYRDEVLKMEARVDEKLLSTVKKDELIINVMDHGATGEGVYDDTDSIQDALNYAEETGYTVFFPPGTYLISDTLLINGVSIKGSKGNIFTDGVGSIIKCKNQNFTALKQGSVLGRNIQFDISNIIVENANIGFELNYVINSKFDNLYAKDCNTGYKLGDSQSVGSMFNIFNNLYSRRCEIGIESVSKDYFNNNIFNNGFIQGNKYALKIEVSGGYGAVNNTFNNVEFRSPLGRGVLLNRSSNTIFNSCYFETGGNAIRVGIGSSITLNDPVFGLFKALNTNSDDSILHFEQDSSYSLLDGGRIYLNAEYSNKYLISAFNTAQYDRITVNRNPSRVGSSTAPGFELYKGIVNMVLDNKRLDKFVDLKLNRHTVARGENHYISDYNVIKNTEKIEGSKITLTKGYWLIDVSLKMDIGTSPATKYVYLRKNGTTFASETHVYNTPESDLRKISLSKVEFFNEGDTFDVFVMYQEGDETIDILGGSQSFVTLKYLG